MNIDNDLLITLRVDPNNGEPVLNQVLRIAVYDEYHAYETYRKVIETFGNEQPFINVIEAEIRHYEELVLLAQKYNVELPVNDWYDKIVLPNTLLECCEVGVAAEIDNIQMYDNLLLHVDEYPDVKDVLYKLQAASYNQHLPAFRQSVVTYTNSENIDLTKIYENNTEHNAVEDTQALSQVNDLRNIATKIATGNVSQQDILKVFNNFDMASLGGVVLGGLGAMQLVKMMNEKKEKED